MSVTHDPHVGLDDPRCLAAGGVVAGSRFHGPPNPSCLQILTLETDMLAALYYPRVWTLKIWSNSKVKISPTSVSGLALAQWGKVG